MTGATTDDYFNASVNGNNMEVSGTNNMHATNEAETVQIGIHKDECKLHVCYFSTCFLAH